MNKVMGSMNTSTRFADIPDASSMPPKASERPDARRAHLSALAVDDATNWIAVAGRWMRPEVEGNLALLAVHPVRRHALDTAKHIPGDGRSAASARGGGLHGGRWRFVGGSCARVA